MIDLLAIFRAGFVRRWHTNPDLAHTYDRIDGHSARVARIILALHPDPSVDLLRAALIHDDGESAVGDIPSPVKETLSFVCDPEFSEMEGEAIKSLWPGVSAYPHDHPDIAWLKFADRLDAYMWAAHHAPHVMDRDGWPEAMEWLIETAGGLGCLPQLRSAVGGDTRLWEACHATA